MGEEEKKLTKAQESSLRAAAYEAIEYGLDKRGYVHEPVVRGQLIQIEYHGHTYYATVNVTLHNPDKFNVQEVRDEYVTKLEASAQRSKERARKAALKAVKAAEKQTNQ